MHSFVSCLPGLLNLRSLSRNTWSSLMLCKLHVPNADSKTEVISGAEMSNYKFSFSAYIVQTVNSYSGLPGSLAS